MRKSEGLIHRVERLKQLSVGMPSDIQFKVVDRVLGNAENIIDEDQSMVNLFAAIERELIAAKDESYSF